MHTYQITYRRFENRGIAEGIVAIDCKIGTDKGSSAYDVLHRLYDRMVEAHEISRGTLLTINGGQMSVETISGYFRAKRI